MMLALRVCQEYVLGYEDVTLYPYFPLSFSAVDSEIDWKNRLQWNLRDRDT